MIGRGPDAQRRFGPLVGEPDRVDADPDLTQPRGELAGYRARSADEGVQLLRRAVDKIFDGVNTMEIPPQEWVPLGSQRPLNERAFAESPIPSQCETTFVAHCL